jgi:hypothetical protein
LKKRCVARIHLGEVSHVHEIHSPTDHRLVSPRCATCRALNVG